MSDITLQLQEKVQAAVAATQPLRISGSGSKDFYGREPTGETLAVGAHHGIINYEPTELVITARAGTVLSEIETALAEHKQMLPFEPPHFGPGATLGGTIACNFSGPRRAYAGAARDFVLGCRILNGKGEVLRFGGEVMKNVAGYDVSRLMAGALGTLGVLLEISLKVLPCAESEITLRLEMDAMHALEQLHRWHALPLPLSATCHVDGCLYVRLGGTAGAVAEARARIGGEEIAQGAEFWVDIREQRRPFFNQPENLWRVSLASDAPPFPGACLYEWGGALRWLCSDAPAAEIRAIAKHAGGHATLFRGEPRDEAFQALPTGLLRLHKNLKQAFDPVGIFNPGRMYAEF